MALGKYGIGLLGFWAVGEQMHIKSRVGGGDAWRLVLFEDSPEARVERRRRARAWVVFTSFAILAIVTVERYLQDLQGETGGEVPHPQP